MSVRANLPLYADLRAAAADASSTERGSSIGAKRACSAVTAKPMPIKPAWFKSELKAYSK